MDRVADLVYRWVFDSKRLERIGCVWQEGIPCSASTIESQEIAPGWNIQALRVDSERQQAWGFRLIHPDAEYSHLVWATEITVSSKTGELPFFTCSSLVGDRGQVFVPIRRRPSRPRIVADVLDEIGGTSVMDGRSVFPLLTKPLDLSESNTDREIFLGALTSERRTLPIIFFSAINETNLPLVDAMKVANHLAGLAHVVLARNSTVSWNLADRLPQHLNCYGGAVRLYWPGLKLSDPGFRHPLWTPQRIAQYGQMSTQEVGLQLLEAIASISAFKLPANFLTWDDLLDLKRKRAIAEAKERALTEAQASGKKNEWAELLEADNSSLAQEIRALKEQLAAQSEEVEQQRSIAESYRFALEQERRQPVDAMEVEMPDLPAMSVCEAVENAERIHSERLAFCFNNRSEHRDSPFHAPEEVERALNWLATTYFDSRSKKVSCQDLDANLAAAIPGWHYSAHQKEATMKACEPWYRCPWPSALNGKIWIPEHLKGGADRSRRPEDTIRVAFAWVDESQKVVIGFIGQHQENTRT